MESKYVFLTTKVKLGNKGQITIPKKIRDQDMLRESDVFIVTHTFSGDIVLKKQKIKTPEDLIFESIQKASKFNWREAWKEVVKERSKERS